MNEFLRWYVPFSISDDSVRHVLKSAKSHGQKFYCIDTLGAKAEVDRYYRSGFFTELWKENTIRNLLAADKILFQYKYEDLHSVDLNMEVVGLIGDAALSFVDHEKSFAPGFKWEVKNFKVFAENVFSINLFLDSGWGPVHEWAIQLVLEHGQLKINDVSYPILVD
ncbi:MAG TPA: hypothetical protein VLX91_09125 [Candidatus Acidoferrales bacterium]|nr:hypothetical protein [Candidatus Acidoferrales bacterium]